MCALSTLMPSLPTSLRSASLVRLDILNPSNLRSSLCKSVLFELSNMAVRRGSFSIWLLLRRSIEMILLVLLNLTFSRSLFVFSKNCFARRLAI